MAVVSTPVGKVMVTPKGAYSTSATYEMLDIITKDGSSYIARQNVPANTPVTNTTYWMLIAEKGDPGASFDGEGVTGVVAVANGGTGASSASQALTNLGAAAASHNHSTSNITSGTLPIARGGTNATTGAEACNQIGAVKKSGDTMSGNLQIVAAGTDATASSISADTAKFYSVNDANSKIFAYWQGMQRSDGSVRAYMSSRKYINDSQVENTLFLAVDKDGNRSVSISDHLAWRKAISANSNGIFQINQGGTGLSASPSMLTNLGTETAANVLQASPRPGITGTLAVGHGGTGATTADGACNQIGAVKKSGDTMTGNLYEKGGFVSVNDSGETVSALLRSSDRSYLRCYNRTSGYRIDAYLPIPGDSETSNSTRYIPFMSAGTSDITAGTTVLSTNCIRLVYE